MFLSGQAIYIEYLEIDELEAKCWLCDDCMLGYLDNTDMSLKLSDIGKRDVVYFKSIDPKTGRIELKK